VAGQMRETLVTTARVVFCPQSSVSWQYIHLQGQAKNLQCTIAVLKKRKMLCDSPLATPGNALPSDSGSNAKSSEVLHVKMLLANFQSKRMYFLFPSIEPPKLHPVFEISCSEGFL
jgi:hypothetical protein